MINKNLLLSTRNSFNKNANTTLSTQNFCEKFEIRIYIKKEEKIKRIITTTTNNIIDKARDTNVETIFSIRKNIIIVKRRFDIVIFRVKTKKSKKILKKTIFEQKKCCRTRVYAKSTTI